jgi:hypothetical protein
MIRKKVFLPLFFFTALLLFKPAGLLAQTAKADTAKAQPKDSVKVVIGKQVSTIAGAWGYMKQTNGRWANAPDKIPFDDPDYNNPLYDKFKVGTENFQQISLYKATIDSMPYYLLFIRYLKGYYKNEETKEGFATYYVADYYFVKRDELKSALPDTVKFGKYFPVTLRAYYPGLIPISNMKDLQLKVNWDVNNNLRTAHLYDTTVKPYVRILTYLFKSPKYGNFVRFNTALAYAKTGRKPAPPTYEIFDSQYYQIPFDKFKLFFRPKD